MEKFKELTIKEQNEIFGGGKFWDWIKKNYAFIIIGAAIGGLAAS